MASSHGQDALSLSRPSSPLLKSRKHEVFGLHDPKKRIRYVRLYDTPRKLSNHCALPPTTSSIDGLGRLRPKNAMSGSGETEDGEMTQTLVEFIISERCGRTREFEESFLRLLPPHLQVRKRFPAGEEERNERLEINSGGGGGGGGGGIGE